MGDLFYRLFVAMAAVLPICAVARWIHRKRKKLPLELGREIVVCLYAAFMAGLVALVLRPGSESGVGLQAAWGKLQTGDGINLLPFHTISNFFGGGRGTAFVVNIIANVLMFAPLGFCQPLLWRRWQSGARMLLLGLCFSVSIEVAQLFIGRSTDVDDVILNVTGVMLGYFVFKVVAKCLKATQRLARYSELT